MSSLQQYAHPSSRRRPIALAKAVAALAATALLAACASSTNSPAGAPQADSAGKGISIVVIGSVSSDPFFSTVKRGVEDAQKAVESQGGKVDYLALSSTNNQGPDTAKLLQTALGMHPSAVVFPDWVPSAEEPTAQQIAKAGIPVIMYNAGNIDNAKAVGAVTLVATDLYLSGEAGGKEFVSAGAKNIVFVNTVSGDTSAEATANGYKAAMTAAGGKFTELNLPSSDFGNPTLVSQAVKSTLLKDPSIDGVATYGAQDADSAYDAIQQANASSRVKLIGFNLSTNTLDRIKAGTQLATIDQQPYAQGYYAVSAAFQYAAFGIKLATQPIITGPLVINSSNVDKAVSGTQAGVR